MEPEETEEHDLGDWNWERREWEGETERSGWLVKHSGRAAAFADGGLCGCILGSNKEQRTQ